MIENRFKDKVVIITGAAGGIRACRRTPSRKGRRKAGFG